MEYLSSELIQRLIEVIVLVIISIIGFGLKKLLAYAETYLDTKIGKGRADLLKDFAGTIVRALEQSPAYKDWDGAQKKERALVAIADYADDHDIPVDGLFLDHVIEEAVKMMKDQQSPLLDIGDFLFDIDEA